MAEQEFEEREIVGVKIIAEDRSETEPSCWAVAFHSKGPDGKLWTQFSWSRRAHSAEEIVVLGVAIERLLGEYNDTNKGIVHIL